MATVDGYFGQELVDRIMADDDGWAEDKEDAPDNPRCIKIVAYKNAAGEPAWGLVFENEPEGTWYRYDRPTDFIHQPKVVWRLPSSE